MSTDVKRTHWTLQVEEDLETGDLVLSFPPELLNQAGWDFGDTISWEDMGNGSWALKKVDKGNEEKV